VSDWLDLELAHRLTPVKAPEGLWERVARGLPARTHRSRPTAGWMACPVATFATIALVATTFWLPGAGPARLELRSQNPTEIRRWVYDRTGVEVPLAPSANVRLEGARMLRRGDHPAAAITFRAGQRTATLLVARADPRAALPPRRPHATVWQSGDQAYALTGTASGAACQLCHASL